MGKNYCVKVLWWQSIVVGMYGYIGRFSCGKVSQWRKFLLWEVTVMRENILMKRHQSGKIFLCEGVVVGKYYSRQDCCGKFTAIETYFYGKALM